MAIDKQIKDLDLNGGLALTDNFVLQNGITEEVERTTLDDMKTKILQYDEYQEIGRTTLGGTADSIVVSALPAYKYLKLLVSIIPSGVVAPYVQFNADTGANYSFRYDQNNGTTGSGVSQTSAILDASNSASLTFIEVSILNITTSEKIYSGFSISNGTAGAGNLPNKDEVLGKWANTAAQISSVNVINLGAGDFASGSQVIVYGHN